MDSHSTVTCIPLCCMKLKSLSVIRCTPMFDLPFNFIILTFRVYYSVTEDVGNHTNYKKPFSSSSLMLSNAMMMIVSLHNIVVYNKVVRNRLSYSFKLYDILSTLLNLITLVDLFFVQFALSNSFQRSATEEINPQRDNESLKDRIIMIITMVLLCLISIRLLFTFTYHVSVIDHYKFGEFDETPSEYNYRMYVDNKRIERFKQNLDVMKANNDLATVKESFNEKDATSVIPIMDSVPDRFSSPTKHAQTYYEKKQKPEPIRRSEEYHSFQ